MHLFKQDWRFVDDTHLHSNRDALHSFAYDDTFCTLAGQGKSPATIRAWVHPATVVLGTQDSRLPHIHEGIAYLQESGYHVLVRNSGGLAVVLDEGVLNLSLIMKEEKGLSIDTGYELMYQLIKTAFRGDGYEIEAGEIRGSYCPGRYDLSIDEKKFAGISQRRLRGGVAVQIYLCLNGSGSGRAELIRRFYELSTQGVATKFKYPLVKPSTMASMAELINKPFTVKGTMEKIGSTMMAHGAALATLPFTEEEQRLFTDQLTRVQNRNEKCLGVSNCQVELCFSCIKKRAGEFFFLEFRLFIIL